MSQWQMVPHTRSQFTGFTEQSQSTQQLVSTAKQISQRSQPVDLTEKQA